MERMLQRRQHGVVLMDTPWCRFETPRPHQVEALHPPTQGGQRAEFDHSRLGGRGAGVRHYFWGWRGSVA